jgi:hypothetical protein
MSIKCIYFCVLLFWLFLIMKVAMCLVVQLALYPFEMWNINLLFTARSILRYKLGYNNDSNMLCLVSSFIFPFNPLMLNDL